MDLFNRKKRLEGELESIKAELATTKDDLLAASELINELQAKNKELEAKASGVPMAEHQEMVDKYNKLNDDFVKLTEENETIIDKMKDFDKSAADKAVEIVAECGVDPVTVEPMSHPAQATEHNKETNQRYVIRDLKK